ncbi:MAG TPA: phosphoribosylformimino-5-aminoimidazole carboxamide ribotide isomerase, partial [Verrucomicrobiae bacterium]|nr:phosphoribosylformimino-5-aminoimidazole carboxamide ribotide isomerase [Verrucomicrobiae bacterium]
QIVGGTLGAPGDLHTNFVAFQPAAWFAELYKRDGLCGGHVIMLGPGNESEAHSALAAFPDGLQIGGGINSSNAMGWLEAGASHVIVTSWVFRDGKVDWERLGELLKIVGKTRLVLDLSCRKRRENYFVVTDRWQKFTELIVNEETLQKFSTYCAEFLIHAVDVEGLCSGIDSELVSNLGKWTPIPMTYAGGARSIADLAEVTRLSGGKVDLTIGSALDIFGGNGVKYEDCVKFNHSQKSRNMD